MNFNEKYIYKNGNAIYSGGFLDEAELKQYLPGKVKNKLLDSEGSKALLEAFNSLAKSDFRIEILRDVFKSNTKMEPWRIGEALVECYLEENKNCKFYYNYSRDSKNSQANLSGADIVGFTESNNVLIFLFGEIKTSSDVKTPPDVVYGRSGLTKQLEKLKDDQETISDLIKWLGFKVLPLKETDNFRVSYKNALKTYLDNKKKIKIIGVLVRDTPPNESDLKSRFASLTQNLSPDTHLELIGLYLPIGIGTLNELVGK